MHRKPHTTNTLSEYALRPGSLDILKKKRGREKSSTLLLLVTATTVSGYQKVALTCAMQSRCSTLISCVGQHLEVALPDSQQPCDPAQ